jgi:hypothetical protein
MEISDQSKVIRPLHGISRGRSSAKAREVFLQDLASEGRLSSLNPILDLARRHWPTCLLNGLDSGFHDFRAREGIRHAESPCTEWLKRWRKTFKRQINKMGSVNSSHSIDFTPD